MDNPATKDELLHLVRTEWAVFEDILKQVQQQKMVEPNVENGWSVKDILAHITAWEKLMCQWLEEAVRGDIPERPQDDAGIDRLNARLYAQNRDKSLDEVLADFQNTHQRSLKVIQLVPENDLFDPQRFDWREGDPLWYMVGGNTFWHYREHSESIQAWLETKSMNKRSPR